MEGLLGIEHNRDALRRIVAALVAMAGVWGQFTFFPREGAAPSLPRRLHRAVLRLLRPAEAAARRLIIALSRGIAVTLPAGQRHGRETKPKIPRFGKAAHISMQRAAVTEAAPSLRPLALPLIDPLRRPFARPWVKLAALPRICVPGVTERLPIPVREDPSPHDPLDASRLARRLQALSLALDDLPRQALRFARWQARRRLRPDKDRARRRWPLRLGRPPGWRRRRNHEVFDVLDHANQLAHFALEHPDSS